MIMQDGVRFAETAEELSASYQLRYKVYVEGMGRLKDKGDHELKELRDEYDPFARAIVVIKDGKAIGTLRLFWGGDHPFCQTLIDAYHLAPFQKILADKEICIIERLMVDQAHRGSAVALQMYKLVWDFSVKHHIEAGFLDCEPHHLNSYLKLGFRPFAKTYSYPGIGLVIPMMYIPGDYEHLKHVGSPFSLLIKDGGYKHTEQLIAMVKDASSILPKGEVDDESYLAHIYRDDNLIGGDKPKMFDMLTEVERDRVIEKSVIITCNKGDRIIEANNAARTMFILLTGYVEVYHPHGPLLTVVTPGEVIGEIAFFRRIPRTASIIAATDDVTLLSLDEPTMSRLLKYEPALASKILLNICNALCERVISNAAVTSMR